MQKGEEKKGRANKRFLKFDQRIKNRRINFWY